jgi:hypothetical protein
VGFEGSETELATAKYSQELASKFWVSGVAVLSAILFTVYPPEKKCEVTVRRPDGTTIAFHVGSPGKAPSPCDARETVRLLTGR